MTAQVMMPKPQMISIVLGSHGKTPESSARHTSPSPVKGSNATVTRIIGAPIKAVTSAVRRGEDGMSAARMAIIIAMPLNCSIDT